MTKHIHADLIHAWADGAEIQFKNARGKWIGVNPAWSPKSEYRIKPSITKREGWIIIRQSSVAMAYAGTVYASYEEAMKECGLNRGVATIKIEWEEEQ